jgi:Ion channel
MTIVYAMIGIPLTLLAIAHVGGFLATLFRFIYKNILCDLLVPLLRNTVKILTRPCRRRLGLVVEEKDAVDASEAVEVQPSETTAAAEEDLSKSNDVCGDPTARVDDDDVPEVVVVTNADGAGSGRETPSFDSNRSDSKLPISPDHSDSTISERQLVTTAACDSIVAEDYHTGDDGVRRRTSGSGNPATKNPAVQISATAAIRKSLRMRKDAALKQVQHTKDMFFAWRRGVTRALYNDDNQQVRVPVHISLLMIAGYIILGSMMFGLWESDWNLLIGSYFCFITLSTIGFGDYVPGTSLDSSAETAKLVLCSMYLVVGLAMLAMCFELMQEEARQAFTGLGRMLGLVEDEKPQGTVAFSDGSPKEENSEGATETT